MFIFLFLLKPFLLVGLWSLQFYLVATGRGDEHDPRARARGVTASFSLNGLSVPGGGSANQEPDEPVDLYRENEELKVIKK